MPIYEYYCPACHGRYSALQKIGQTPPPCPRCRNEHVEKLISAAGLVRSEQEHAESFHEQRRQVDPNDRQAIARFFRESSKELSGQFEGEVTTSEAFAELVQRVEAGAGEADIADLAEAVADATNSPYKMLGPESDPASQAFIDFAETHEHRARKLKLKTADNLGWAKSRA